MAISKIQNLKYALGFSNVKISRKLSDFQKNHLEKILPDLEKVTKDSDVNIKFYPISQNKNKFDSKSNIYMDVIKTKFINKPLMPICCNDFNSSFLSEFYPAEYIEQKIVNVAKYDDLINNIIHTARTLEQHIKENIESILNIFYNK